MAKAGKKKHKPESVNTNVPPDPQKATFKKLGGKNQVEDEKKKKDKTRAKVGAAVTFSNEISAGVVIVLCSKIVLSDNDNNLAPRALFLEGWNGTGTPPFLTFTASGSPGDECHYKVIVDFSNGDGDIGTNSADQIVIDSGGGQDPEIIIVG